VNKINAKRKVVKVFTNIYLHLILKFILIYVLLIIFTTFDNFVIFSTSGAPSAYGARLLLAPLALEFSRLRRRSVVPAAR